MLVKANSSCLPTRTLAFKGVQRWRVAPQATKGFGSTEEQKANPKAKVNERGKVASRPGAISEKEYKRTLEEQQKAQAATASAATSAPAAPDMAPSSSTPSSDEPQRIGRPSSSGSMETPQVVVDRIFSRMVIFAGVPVVFGLLLLPVLYYFKKQGGDEFPMWIAYVSQALAFGGGLLGITYGALSASWDATREGSAFGWTEFQANLPIFLSKDKQQ